MGDLRDAYVQSIKASVLVRPVDAALVSAGDKIAAQIDYAVEHLSGQDVTKALYLTPHLVNILRELLATPAARKAAGVSDGGARGKLASLPPLNKPA